MTNRTTDHQTHDSRDNLRAAIMQAVDEYHEDGFARLEIQITREGQRHEAYIDYVRAEA